MVSKSVRSECGIRDYYKFEQKEKYYACIQLYNSRTEEKSVLMINCPPRPSTKEKCSNVTTYTSRFSGGYKSNLLPVWVKILQLDFDLN